MSSFDKEIRDCFLDEATQMVSDAERCFLALETRPGDPEVVDELFRLAHNLKGSANAVGFLELGTFTHRLESLLLKVKNHEVTVSKPVIDLLLRCNDHLQSWVRSLKNDHGASADSLALLEELTRWSQSVSPQEPRAAGHLEPQAEAAAAAEVAAGGAPDQPDVAPTEASPSQATFGEGAFSQAAQEPPAAFPSAPARDAKPAAPGKPADESIRVSLARLDNLLNRVGELVILHSVLKEQSGKADQAALRKTIIQLGKATREVQDLSMGLRMLPIRPAFQKMQRIVRDTSAELDKMVTLHLEGEDTEVDKSVLESLGDPLVHLVRNAVDHGIETMEKRLDAGKSAEGHIHLRAFHHCGNLVIEIEDDGGGLDAAKLQRIAKSKGILPAYADLPDKDAYQLIFAPGFSTKTEVTSISGRGVGMDVVKTNITALQGNIQIETELGSGTCFRITLPLTLAVIDGMIVQSGAGRFVVPLSHVHETIKPTKEDVHYVTGMGDVLSLRGENLPLYHLDNLLKKKPRDVATERSTTIVVRGQQLSFAVMVDEIIGQTQVVTKQLGVEHKNLRGFSGSAILGDGRPALILELEDLNQRANAQPSPQLPMRGTA